MSSGDICARHFATGQPVRLRWQNGCITHVEATTNSCPENSWIAPGLVDLQVNGYGGVDFQQDDLTVEALLDAARQFRAAGGTRFLLTLITDAWPKLMGRLQKIRALREQSAELRAAIVGWHVEGPFLSSEPGYHGAHNPAFMLDPTEAHVRELRAITGNDPLLLTLAPERPGAINAIALASSLGIKISLGHTNASIKILQDAVRAGAMGFTHLGNGCPRELDRHDNILWRVLSTPGLTSGLIPDTIHVSEILFRLLHRFRESDSIYYTTDAMSAAGAPPGPYQLGVLKVMVGADQIVRQPGKTNFAGSALRPIDGIFHAAQMLGRPWQEVWPHFSTIPARFMDLSNGLEPGHPTNFCVLKFNDKNQLLELNAVNGLAAVEL